MQKQSSQLLGIQREFTYDGETIVGLMWITPSTPVPQSRQVRIELSMAADATDTSQVSSTAAMERFHKDQLCEDLQKLANQESLFDCTILATKDKREIKVCDFFCITICCLHTSISGIASASLLALASFLSNVLD